RKQAWQTAKQLSILAPDVIYSSPLSRALETAAIIAERLGIRKITQVPDLIERNFGVLTGKSYDEIQMHATKVIEAHGFQVFIEAEGLESHRQVADRVVALLQTMQQHHSKERVLFVSHGDVYKALLMHQRQLTLDEVLQAPWLENAEIADFGMI